MKSVGIFLISKNNYDFLDKYWEKNFPYKGFEVLNVDEGSSPEEQEKGKAICKKYGFVYMDREDPGLHSNVELACKYFKEKGIKFLTWWQHDCWPYDEKFMNKINNLCDSGKLDAFGSFGFNGLATDVVNNHGTGIKQLSRGNNFLGILGRSCLSDRPWYVGKNAKIKPLAEIDKFHCPFAIESVAWFAIGLNIDLFFKHIKVNKEYGFHLAWDDICYQFLKNNVYNIALPEFYIIHRPDLKPLLGIPKNSAKYTRNKNNNFFFEQSNQLDVWKSSWGWDWINRKSFESVKEKYKDTLLFEFYNHDLDDGPLKTFSEVIEYD